MLVFFGVGFVLPSSSEVATDEPTLAAFLGLLVVILLTTPLQAAAEEVGFRGYLSQAVASWVARPVVGALLAGAVSAVLFALAHGLQDPWLFTDRLAFGLVASWLAWRTGGLEAPIALHIANNVVGLVYSAAIGSLEASLLSVHAGVAVRGARHRDDGDLRAAWPTWSYRRGGYAVRRTPALPTGGPGTPGALSGPGGVGYPVSRPPTPPPAGSDNPWGMG